MLAVAALVVALVSGLDLVVVIAVYLALSLLYCFVLKDEPVIDIAIIAAGFLLRAIAGGAAAGIELSQWFLLAASFGSLFMAAGKRYAEILLVAQGGPALRASLASLQPVLPALRLDRVGRAADHDLRAVGLRAAARKPAGTGGTSRPWRRSCWRCSATRSTWTRGSAEEPEELALRDRMLEVFAGCWLVMVAIAVYSELTAV